jgi:hypothetical protein
MRCVVVPRTTSSINLISSSSRCLQRSSKRFPLSSLEEKWNASVTGFHVILHHQFLIRKSRARCIPEIMLIMTELNLVDVAFQGMPPTPDLNTINLGSYLRTQILENKCRAFFKAGLGIVSTVCTAKRKLENTNAISRFYGAYFNFQVLPRDCFVVDDMSINFTQSATANEGLEGSSPSGRVLPNRKFLPGRSQSFLPNSHQMLRSYCSNLHQTYH